MQTAEQQMERISGKLDIIIGLLTRLAKGEETSDSALIRELTAKGLTAEETARALGKSSNSVYLARSRRRRKET